MNKDKKALYFVIFQTESSKPESQHGPGASYLEPAEAAWPAWPIKKKY